jgi:hypothetical protein
MKNSLIILFIYILMQSPIKAQIESINQKSEIKTVQNSKENLAILWTSSDLDVAIKMVFMYAKGAKKNNWWKSINIIIWGPSSKLTSENETIQNEIKEMQELGIIVEACKACADQYGVSDKLEEMNISVKYMGEPLTDFLKSDDKVITF